MASETARASRWSRLQAAIPRLFAAYIAFIACYSAIRAVFPPLRHPNLPTSVIESVGVPTSASIAYAAFTIILAGALARRKRVAFWLLVIWLWLNLLVTLAVLALVALVPGLINDTEDMVLVVLGVVNVPFLITELVLLFLARSAFYARVQRGSFRKAIATLIAGLTVTFLLGYLLTAIQPGTLHKRKDRAAWAIKRLLGSADPFGGGSGAPPHWIKTFTGLCAALALFLALYVLLKSQRAAAVLPAADEQRIRELLAAHGERDSLGYFATRRDKSAVFSPSGKAAVTYRVVAGVCLASGDPIGDPEAWAPAIDAWTALARSYAWRPAVMGASETGARAYARAGLRALQLGDEAVLEVADFSLEGRDMRGIRQAVNRVQRAGYTAQIRRHADIPPEDMNRLIAKTDAWRDTETERGFSMALGRLGDPADGQCVLVEAIAPDGTEAAVLSLAPWGRHGLSLDLMRRDRESDNGLMEFMVTALIQAAGSLGVTRISLNFAVFRAVFEEGSRIGAGPVLRLWRKLLLFFSRWWQIESLYRSNVKYRPEWVPRFMCYGETRDVATVGIASAIAEGFLTAPSLSALLRRGRRTHELPAGLPGPAPAGPDGDRTAAPDGSGAGPDTPDGAPTGTLTRPGPDGGRRAGLPEQVRLRMSKMDKMRAAGVDPYPVGFAPTDSCAAVAERHRGLGPDTRTGEKVQVAGRVLLYRDLGGVCFARIRDWSGDLQVMLTAADLDPTALDRWRSDVDLGDHVGITGEVVTSRRGELSVLVESWTMTAKCLRPLPDKRRGLADPEARVRQRYLDLAISRDARRVLTVRSAAIRSLRDSLAQRGYLEVETPILQRIHGGANARPFTTHINAYDLRLYLRIAPELYLKRLCVGGVERVFELGRTFRNEGADATHNPEFTMLEAYQAYGDYRTMLVLTRELIQRAATAAYGSTVLPRTGPDGTVSEVDIGGEWPVVTVNDAISAAVGARVTADTGRDELAVLADKHGVPYDPKWSRGALLLELYERLVEHHTGFPTFYTDFPTEVSPLTRQHRDDPRLAERWDLVAFGAEIGTAYTELTDPVEQRRRLTEQSLLAAGGDPEAMELDEDFLLSLEYAMPPTGGLGIGVDRLIIMLTGLSIRDTLPFPIVRPSHGAG